MRIDSEQFKLNSVLTNYIDYFPIPEINEFLMKNDWPTFCSYISVCQIDQNVGCVVHLSPGPINEQLFKTSEYWTKFHGKMRS